MKKWLPIIFLSIFLLTFVTGYKVYFIVLSLIGLIFFLLSPLSLTQVLSLLLLVSIFFEVGITSIGIQTVFMNVPTFWETTPLEEFQYQFFFTLSYKFLLSLALLSFALPKIKTIIKTKDFGHHFFIFFIFIAAVSASISDKKDLAFFGILQLISYLGVYIVFFAEFSQKKFVTFFQNVFIALALLINIIGIGQIILQKPIGLYIEQVRESSQFGFVTTDGWPLFRVSGQLSHPTYFGSILSFALPILIGIYLQNKKNYISNKFLFFSVATAICLSFVNIFATFSRSAWLAAGLIILCFFIYLKKTSLIKSYSYLSLPLIAIASTIVILFPNQLSNRIRSFTTFNSIGNGQARMELINHAFEFIKNKPLTGVGLNQFTVELDKKTLSPDMRFFVFPVHNTIVLFFSELGIIVGAIFVLWLINILYKGIKLIKIDPDPFTFGLVISILTFILNSQFHTLFNQDPTFDLLVIAGAYLTKEYLWNQKKLA